MSISYSGFVSAGGGASTAGPAGPQGPTGAAGSSGVAGAVGATGAQGSIGLTGATGSQGNTGATGAAGSQGIQGIQGIQGASGAQGTTGAAGPGALITTTSQRSYSAGTSIQPSTTNDVQITASWAIATTITLTGGSGGTVKLLSDSSATPTTEVARVTNSASGSTVVAGVSLNSTQTLTINYRVKAGDRYKFTTTNDAATPVFTLVGGVVIEQVLG